MSVLEKAHEVEPTREMNGIPAIRPARRSFDAVVRAGRNIQ
jgi:hypothetical protein